MAMELKATDFEVIPTGEYPARILKVSQDTGQFGEQLKFALEIAQGEHKGTQLLYWTPAKLSSGNKLGKLVIAAGIDFESGEVVNIEDVLNRVVSATVIISQKKSDGSEFNKVEGLRAIKKKAPAKKTVEVEVDEDEDMFENE